MYILTGGAGFIGSNFLHYLNSRGIDDICVVDSLGRSEKWKNLARARFDDYLDKTEFLKRIEQGDPLPEVTAIVHLGACSSTTETDADYMLANNYRYSKTLAQWAIEKGVRFVYASSAATYGSGELGFSDDDSTTPSLNPLNVYALSKHLFDIWALRTKAAEKIVGLKFFNVYGPNEYHKGDMRSVVYKSFHQVKESGKVQLFRSHIPEYSDGEQKRDFVYVKDCCELLWWFLENPSSAGIFNLGTGKAQSWNDLVNAVFNSLNLVPNIEYIDMPPALRGKYQYFTQAQMGKLQTVVGDFQFRPLEAGVRDYVENHLNSDDPYLG